MRHMRHQNLKGYPMPKEEWGTKRLCPETGKRFYDLNATPIISPLHARMIVAVALLLLTFTSGLVR